MMIIIMVLLNCTPLSFAKISQNIQQPSGGGNVAPQHAMSVLPLNSLGSVLTVSCNPGRSRYRSCHQWEVLCSLAANCP